MRVSLGAGDAGVASAGDIGVAGAGDGGLSVDLAGVWDVEGVTVNELSSSWLKSYLSHLREGPAELEHGFV